MRSFIVVDSTNLQRFVKISGSQVKAAKILGYSDQHIYMMLTGRKRITINLEERLKNLLREYNHDSRPQN